MLAAVLIAENVGLVILEIREIPTVVEAVAAHTVQHERFAVGAIDERPTGEWFDQRAGQIIGHELVEFIWQAAAIFLEGAYRKIGPKEPVSRLPGFLALLVCNKRFP